MRFFRSLYFDIKYFFEEILLAFKHPTRVETYKDMYRHWRDIWSTLIFHPWYCLKRGICNLIHYFTIIWSTDVYDHTYLTELMDKKMEEMEKFFQSNKTHLMNAKRVAKQIRWTRKLYDMYCNDYYSTLWHEEHTKKFKTELFKSKPCRWDEYGVPTLFECEPMSQEASEHYKSGSNKAFEKDKKVFKLFIKNLSKLQGWWD